MSACCIRSKVAVKFHACCLFGRRLYLPYTNVVASLSRVGGSSRLSKFGSTCAILGTLQGSCKTYTSGISHIHSSNSRHNGEKRYSSGDEYDGNRDRHNFFKLAYQKSTFVARFGLLPGVFLYESVCQGGTAPDTKGKANTGYNHCSVTTGTYAGLDRFSYAYLQRRGVRTFHSTSKDSRPPSDSDDQKLTISKREQKCSICGNDSVPNPAKSNTPNLTLRSDSAQPRLAAPDVQKTLPEPPLDPLYFYHYSSRQEILREISGFFPRLRARLRRALKGSYQKRPWTIDDIFALVTWVLMSQAMLLLVGTTTTVSVILWLLNRLQYQDWIAHKLSKWVSSALGITVSFESAIVPAWSHGAIRLKNVRIYCGPEHGHILEDGSRDENFTMYDLHVDQIDVALSLWRWMDDRGLIRECSMRGIRGSVDWRQVWWDPSAVYVPEEFRSMRRPGYFDLDSLEIEDMLLTVHPWQNFRPITVSIYSASLPRFRDRWLLYDTLNASSIVGMYDGSLFTIHQAHQHLHSQVSSPYTADNVYSTTQSSGQGTTRSGKAAHTTHVQIDNLNIDHINAGVEGPIGWITSGRLNVSALISFPPQSSSTDPAMVIRKIVDNISDSIDVVILPSVPDWSNPEKSPNPLVRGLYHLDMVDSPLAQEMHDRLRRRAERESQRRLEKQRQRTASWSQPLAPIATHQTGSFPRSISDAHSTAPLARSQDDPTAAHIDLQVEFNDIRASVPLTTPQLGHPLLSSVLVRPIVAYMNAHRTSLPMRCQLRLQVDDFDGAWSFWDSGADALISRGIGAAFTQLAYNERERNRRLKLVGVWSITAILKQLIRLVDFVNSQRSFFHFLGTTAESDRI